MSYLLLLRRGPLTLTFACGRSHRLGFRGHQNFLEAVPSFLTFLVLGGIYYPLIAAGLGALYLVSRISYASGYASGDPKKRYYGSYGIPGQIGLLGLSIHALLKFSELI